MRQTSTASVVRAAKAPRTVPSGHGLGLAIVRSIARGHHGTVTAHARAKATGGLLVRVELPAWQEAPTD